jgi:uncharacterized protein YjiS (DUF1127 family)
MRSTLSETTSKSSYPLLAEIGAIAGAVDAGIAQVVDRLLSWQQRVRDRHALTQLDEHMLHDIGLSRADVEREASKPFWRA